MVINGDKLKELVNSVVYTNNKCDGFGTGIEELDKLINGFEKGKLYIIGGRPMTGKTTFALSIIENVAVKQGKTVEMYSLEMSAKLLVKKLLTKIPEKDLKESKLIINDDIFFDSEQIANCGAEMIIVDYIQLAGVNNKKTSDCTKMINSRAQELEHIIRYLKDVARTLNIPVIVISQLGRGLEYREDHRPKLSDLRDTGVMEELADVIMLLYRDELYCYDSSDIGITEIDVAKNRFGGMGVIKHAF